MKFLELITGWFIKSIAVIGVILVGIQTYLGWINTNINQTRLDIEHGSEVENRKEKQAEKERLDKELKDAQIKNLQGWQASDLDYNIQEPPAKESCFAIDGVDPEGAFENKLFWSREITQAFKDIVEDLEDLVISKKVDPNKAEKKTGSYRYFKRRNGVLYGAAGTGKTEFIKQMARVIKERYPKWVANDFSPNDPNYDLLNSIEKKIPPIIQIDGASIKAPGKGSPVGDKIDSHEKLIAIIKKAKQDYYGDEFSNKPYIVFIEEADQGCNVMDKEAGKLLEDWKNFLSTPRDDQQLRGGAQDFNSCIIIATNNYENLDPALFRYERLGKKLNFNWNPFVLKDYLKYWYKNDLKHLKFTLPEKEEGWEWEKNSEPQELYKLTTKIGFDIAKHELAPHLPKIYCSWQNLSEEEKKLKANELGTKKNKKNKDVCNWILHYLFTFHQWNNKRQLEYFDEANMLERYDYGHQYRMEELSRNSIIQTCNNLIALKDAIATGLAQIRAEMAANFEENAILKQEILIARQEIKRAEDSISSLRQSVANNSGIQSELVNLQSQINDLVKRINSGSVSGSSSDPQTVQKYSSLSQAITRFTSRLSAYRNGGGTDANEIIKIVNEFIDDIKNFSAV